MAELATAAQKGSASLHPHLDHRHYQTPAPAADSNTDPQLFESLADVSALLACAATPDSSLDKSLKLDQVQLERLHDV